MMASMRQFTALYIVAAAQVKLRPGGDLARELHERGLDFSLGFTQ
jgi:hypothetical protein